MYTDSGGYFGQKPPDSVYIYILQIQVVSYVTFADSGGFGQI